MFWNSHATKLGDVGKMQTCTLQKHDIKLKEILPNQVFIFKKGESYNLATLFLTASWLSDFSPLRTPKIHGSQFIKLS